MIFRNAMIAFCTSSLVMLCAASARPEPRLNFATIEQRLKDKQQPIRTMPDFLRWVSETYPQQFKHYTLVKQSRSIQSASAKNPRVITFGMKDFILTFNGNDRQVGGNTVEMMQIKRAANHFTELELRELSFNERSEMPAVLSRANPGKCARCHSSPSKPIWNDYPRWDGIFGHQDDKILPTDEENAEIIAFNQERKNHPRYQFLKPAYENDPIAPYTREAFDADYIKRPNLALTKIIAELNADLVLSRAQSAGECWEELKPVTTFLLRGCFDNNSYVDEEAAMNQTIAKYLPPSTDPRYGGRPQTGAYIANYFRLFGIEWDDWALGLKKWRIYFYDGAQDITQFARNRLLGLSLDRRSYDPDMPECKNLYPAVKEIFVSKDEAYRVSASCEAKLPHNDRDGSDLVGMCQSCHDNAHAQEARAPVIPFEDKQALENLWIDRVKERTISNDPARQMPPQRRLSEGERDALLKTLSAN